MALYPSSNLDSLVARFSPHLRREFLEMLLAIRDRHSITELAELISAGQIEEVMQVVRAESAIFAAEVNQAFRAAGDRAAPFVADRLGVRVRFHPVDDSAVRIMQRAELRLISEITEAQRGAIRVALSDGVQRGLNPRDQARAFRGSIGLTETQMEHVVNYRRQLEAGDQGALQRALRDKRDDARVARAWKEPLTKPEIDRMVEGYHRRYVRYRSETIARTEAMRAVHEGNEEAFRQMAAEGKVDPRALETEWIPRPRSPRARDHHQSMRGQRVPFGQPFVSGLGNLLRYPGDPMAPPEETVNCGCATATRFQAPAVKVFVPALYVPERLAA